MTSYTVTISCALCSDSYEAQIVLPDGWCGAYSGIDDEHGICPKHQAITGFKESQCPGCVGGWGDCGLFDAFAYSGRKPRNAVPLSELDFRRLKRGICPRRVNGSFTVETFPNGSVQMNEERLDSRPPKAVVGGKALAKAINEYIETFATAHT